MNNVFRLVSPVYDMDMYIFKLDVFTKQAKYELNTAFRSPTRVFNMWGARVFDILGFGLG